jgi:hypothetical protein
MIAQIKDYEKRGRHEAIAKMNRYPLHEPKLNAVASHDRPKPGVREGIRAPLGDLRWNSNSQRFSTGKRRFVNPNQLGIHLKRDLLKGPAPIERQPFNSLNRVRHGN